MNEIISESLKLGLWHQLDVQFAYMLINNSTPEQNSLILAVITLSSYVRQGHVCLPLSMLTPSQLFFGSHIVLASKACEKAGDLSINCWEKLLLSNFIVSNGSCLAPLVLDKRRLYLHRMWKHECLVADFFHCASQELLNISKEKIYQIAKLLNYFFPIHNRNENNYYIETKDQHINWQKIAIAMVFTHRLTIISGGPGTGKTSIISRLLMILSLLSFNNNDSDIHSVVRIATPTGKSAARLNDSINLMTKKYNNLSNFYNNHCSSVQAVTLHRLLGMYFNKTSIQRTQNNFLGLDYLILDESSMIDLSMMAKIVTILPSTAKIIFFGDHKQLASVEPGSVFSDLCYFIGRGYTLKFLERLKDLTNYILPVNKKNKYNIVDSLCLLKKNYRFSSISGVGKLAKAVSLGNAAVVLSLLTTNSNNDLDYIVLKNDADYFDMLMACAFGYIEYLKKILSYNHDNLSCILDIFNQYRVLCALRQGPFGVLRLNSLIENILHHYGLIQLKNGYKNYVGRPIIITSNSPSLSLFNGEVGVILPNNNFKNSRLFAYFLSSNGNIKKISLHELPTHETNFVMTIHKSQGSEFKNIALIFPNKIIPMLNRELLYTGITRACKRLSIYATDQVINYSIHNECKRYSGLIDRLKQLEQDSLK